MREIRVLITEDEPPISRFVKKITEEIAGFSVCGICCSGEEGLELIGKEHPDVLITDIRMPGMTGLELIRRARQLNGEMYFVVISGYRMFEYAKEAIELETAAYILKPIHPGELRDILFSIQERYRKKDMSRRQEELQNAFRKREEERFLQVLSYRSVCLLAVYCGDDRDKISMIASGVNREILSLVYKNWIFFLQDGEEDVRNLEIISTKILARSDRRRTCACIRTPKIRVQEGMIEEVSRLYRTVLRYKIIPGKAVREVLTEPCTCAAENNIPDGTLKNQLRIDIQAGDKKSFQRHFFELFSLWEQNQAKIAGIRSWMHELTALLIKSNFLKAESIPYNERLDEIIWQGDSFAEIRDNLWKEIEEVFQGIDTRTENLRKDEKKLFDQICSLMEKNPEKNHSLQEICDRFQVSQPYVRKIFRIYTGKTYKEYQQEWKIRIACRLLDRNPAMLVREVAEKIGFEQLYFGTVFSKYTGMTPSQYKNRKMAEKKDE